MKRVVVTGMGLVSPLGNNVDTSFQNLIDGQNGIDFITLEDAGNWKVKFAGEVKNLRFEDFIEPKELKHNDRVTNLALIAAKEAYDQASLKDANIDSFRFGTFIGSGIGGISTILQEAKTLMERGMDRLSPFFIPNSIINLIGAKIGLKYHCQGPNLPSVTACSAATNSIGEAYRYLRSGELDVCLAGGAEAAINALGVGGFAAMRALSTSNQPNQASLPFDERRNGFVMGEGAGILVLETLEHALKRQAVILAEVVGYATTTDAFHITAPDEEANGITKCITLALKSASIEPKDIDYINAHGTGTALNDRLEVLGIKKAFGKHAYQVNISSTKAQTGHTLGASGGLESIFCLKALQTGMIPPTLNLDQPDPSFDLNFTPNFAVKKPLKYAMNINMGFGGQNAVLIFKKWEEKTS
ncbi:MAG: beta-ketoacyl-ACP synthase II [Bacilli bacterium]